MISSLTVNTVFLVAIPGNSWKQACRPLELNRAYGLEQVLDLDRTGTEELTTVGRVSTQDRGACPAGNLHLDAICEHDQRYTSREDSLRGAETNTTTSGLISSH